MQLAVILAFYTPPFMSKKMLLGKKSERMLENQPKRFKTFNSIEIILITITGIILYETDNEMYI